MTEQIEIEEGNNSQSQSDDDSGSDLGEGDVVEKEERRIYQPIEFDLNDPKNTFVIDFVSLQPEQQKPNNAPASQVPAVPESGAVPSEAASEVKKKEPNPALFSNRMTSVIQRIEQIYATAADLGYDSDSFIDDDELFDEENDAAAEEEALYQGFYINKGELETKKRSREEVEESEEPAKKKRRVESSDNTASSKKGEGDKERTKKKKKKKKSTTSKKSEGEADATKSEVKVDAAKKKTKKSSSEGEANKTSAKKKGASDTAASPDKKKSKKSAATGSTEQPFKTTQRFEEYLVQLAAAARQFVERHLKEQQTAAAASPNTAAPNTAGASTAPTAASPTATAPAKDKGVRFPRRLEPKLLLVAQELQYLYPKFDFPDTVLQRIAAPFAPVFKTDSVRQRMLRLLQQHKPEQIDEQTELGQLLKIRKYLLARFNERLQFMCDKLKRTVLPGEPPPRWTWSEDFKRWVGEIIELERVIVTLRASESESKKEPGKETKPVDMNKALKKVYGELSAMWPEGWITNQRIATAVKSRGTELRTPKELIAHHTPYLTGEKKDMHDVVSVDLVPTLQATNSSTAHTPAVRSGAVPPPPMPQITQYASTQASVQGLPSGVSFNQLTGLGWSPGSSAHLPGTFPNYLYPQQTMYSNKPGEYPYYAPPPQ